MARNELIHPDHHPVVFRAGRARTLDTAGRVERFKQRYGGR
ncbi:50S ribosomal protein L31 [Actinomadura rudentiformis]|uniref:50S ribosomal protein L31 n=1 Tax=Actinomadura rudentiformis TaxID=359158 RepID=A0A6H9YV86_9ACTN|nr:50S ribosomal protein L31 [Actinomadura rudentiformis]KAB2349696.1 50S ribosomal protein L31 [Actinomadura rudentiformis]